MNYRDIDTVRKIIKDATGLEVSYAYDDLVFPENMAFLIRFDDQKPTNFFCYFRTDCPAADRKQLIFDLRNAAVLHRGTMEQKGEFNLEQKGEEVAIEFIGD